MHQYAELARHAVEEYIRTGKVLSAPEELPKDMLRQAGVFVCLKVHGRLRGCIGTFHPSCKNLYQEIVRNAVSASTEDPRFSLVRFDELNDIAYTVDVLSEPEKTTVDELDPKKYGIIVVKGNRRGLLLPDLEGVDTVEEQLRITKMKAGIPVDAEDVEVYRFTVDRYS
ncbi:MAG TPA: AmmeMemoRadiSam system protein A [Dissulfurispiraceae bacterium]|nr:AmmeMemoRadiSam system protein A [Dissulfurispiraceae bacterium]